MANLIPINDGARARVAYTWEPGELVGYDETGGSN